MRFLLSCIIEEIITKHRLENVPEIPSGLLVPVGKVTGGGHSVRKNISEPKK